MCQFFAFFHPRITKMRIHLKKDVLTLSPWELFEHTIVSNNALHCWHVCLDWLLEDLDLIWITLTILTTQAINGSILIFTLHVI